MRPLQVGVWPGSGIKCGSGSAASEYGYSGESLKHGEFEQHVRRRGSQRIQRLEIQRLLGLERLCEVEVLLLHYYPLDLLELRDVSPVVKVLKKRRVQVRVTYVVESRWKDGNGFERVDYSEFFDRPSTEDLRIVEEKGRLDLWRLEGWGHNYCCSKDVMKPQGMWLRGERTTKAQWRVYLHRHYKLYRKVEEEKAIEAAQRKLEVVE